MEQPIFCHKIPSSRKKITEEPNQDDTTDRITKKYLTDEDSDKIINCTREKSAPQTHFQVHNTKESPTQNRTLKQSSEHAGYSSRLVGLGLGESQLLQKESEFETLEHPRNQS